MKKPHIKVIQRNGVDVFVTSSMKVKTVKRREIINLNGIHGMENAAIAMAGGLGGFSLW